MIQRISSKAMYLQISDFLQKQIEEGVYKEGTKIPTETELMEQFQVSRTTVRLALKDIMKDGLLETQPGKGTFVSKGRIYHHLKGCKGLYETLLEAGITAETKLIGFQVVQANENVANALKVSKDTNVLRVLRLYHVEQKPISLAEIYIHPDFSHLITEEDAELYPVYKSIADRGGYKVKQAHFEIFAKNASDSLADTLKIKSQDAVLGAERILYSDENLPVEHTYLWFRADAYRFTLALEGETKLQLIDASKFHSPKNKED